MSSDESSELYRLNRGLTEEVSVLSVAIARMEEQLKLRKECPNPGLCLPIQLRVEVLEKRANINDGERAGMTSVGKLVWAFIGCGGMAAVASAYALINKK